MPSTAKGLGTHCACSRHDVCRRALDLCGEAFRAIQKSPQDNEARTWPSSIRGCRQVPDSRSVLEGQQGVGPRIGLGQDGDGVITSAKPPTACARKLGAASTGTGEVLRRGVKGAEVAESYRTNWFDLVTLGACRKLRGGNFRPLTEMHSSIFSERITSKGTALTIGDAGCDSHIDEGIKRGSEGNVVRACRRGW